MLVIKSLYMIFFLFMAQKTMAQSTIYPQLVGKYVASDENLNNEFCGQSVVVNSWSYISLEVEKQISLDVSDIILRFNDIGKFAVKCYQDPVHLGYKCLTTKSENSSTHVFTRSCYSASGRCNPRQSPVEESLKIIPGTSTLELKIYDPKRNYNLVARCLYFKK